MNNRIKEVRTKLKITQQEFADRIGCSRSGLANYEVGRNEPINSVIVAICREFNVNEEWLRRTGKPRQRDRSFHGYRYEKRKRRLSPTLGVCII